MNILFITHSVVLAGANRSMLQLITELKVQYDIHPVVLIPNCGGAETLENKLTAVGIDYLEGPVYSFKTHCRNPLIRLLLLTKHILLYIKNWNFYKKLIPYNFDIIHSNGSTIDYGAYLSMQLKVKHVWHLREFGELDYGLKAMGGCFYEKFIYRKADVLIAISRCVANHYRNVVDHRKIHVIYNGIKDVDHQFHAIHTNQRVQFLCAGLIFEGKNQKEIILAADELVNHRHVHHFHVTIIGIPSEPYCTNLKNIIKERNLTANVSILPEADGIQEIAAKMDVGIVSSRAEAFGRITIEYMLQNLLVIACDSGANPELIEDGKTGYLYEAGNHVALADKMEQVIMAKSFPTDVSEAGMAFAKKNFLSKYNTEKVYNLYCELLDKIS